MNKGVFHLSAFALLIIIVILSRTFSFAESLPYPVKEIDLNNRSLTNYSHFTPSNGTLFFIAMEGVHGVELWKSDGTETGTSLVKDINPNADGCNYTSDDKIIDINGTVFFEANDGIHGSELWITDGSEAGTYMVKDINSSEYGGQIYFLTEMNNKLFYNGSNVVNGRELWVSDGTETGTYMVKDIWPGIEGSSPRYIVEDNGTLFFIADDINGTGLWKSDGTESGTVLIEQGGSSNLLVVDSTLYFIKKPDETVIELWKRDETDIGTVLVKRFDSIPTSSLYWFDISNVGNTVFVVMAYYDPSDGITYNQLWKSDGTEAGTVFVKRIRDWDGWSLYNLTASNGLLCFAANDYDNGRELWRSDGTPEGTFLIKDINPTGDALYPLMDRDRRVLFDYTFADMNDTLYFTADDGVNGIELWKTDGTESGTAMVKDINQQGSSEPLKLTAMDDVLYFGANNGTNSTEVWRSDGTDQGTYLVKDINPRGSLDPKYPVDFNGELFFSGDDGTHGRELWKTDGTEAGTIMVKDINPKGSGMLRYSDQHSVSADYPAPYTDEPYFTIANNNIYFVADDGIHGRELWQTDGTESGTAMVKDINPLDHLGGDGPYSLGNMNDDIYFALRAGQNGSQQELWKSDGTDAGSLMLYASDDYIYLKPSIPNLILIAINDGVHGYELWRSDGTAMGTEMVKDINPFGDSFDPYGYNASEFIESNGEVYFAAHDGINGYELWKTDGTDNGTMMVKDINPSGNSWPEDLTKANNGAIYFTAIDGVNGKELWKTDGTEAGTIMVKDINPNGGSAPIGLKLMENGELIFTAYDDIHSREIWRSDGTEAGTIMIKDINLSGSAIYTPEFTSATINNIVYFIANDGIHMGDQIWKTDGTESGTKMLTDISMIEHAYPFFITASSDNIYFPVAENDVNDFNYGTELWAIKVFSDLDEDNIQDNEDNCPTVSNPDQADLDDDGTGDVCDDDRDGDDVLNNDDNCPNACNPLQMDADLDGIGDLCDWFPGCTYDGCLLCEEPCPAP